MAAAGGGVGLSIMDLTNLLVLAFSVATLPLVVLFALEIFCSIRTPAPALPAEAPGFTVIVPAHNEAEVIGATLDAIVPQLRVNDRLLVVADNCSDATAQIAAMHGAIVTARQDPARRGKGFALAHGVAYATRWANPVTLIVDADCEMGAGALQRLAAEVVRFDRPVQGDYQLTAPRHASLSERFNAFAIRTKNYVRLLGCTRLGVPCTLTGSGMAFPRTALEQADLGSGEIVEDLLLAVRLALADQPARFCPQATIRSPLPSNTASAGGQRARWEQGKLSVMRRFAGPLLAHGIRRGQTSLVLLGLDLSIPPLSLLAFLLGGLLFLTLTFAVLGGSQYPLMVVASQIILFVIAVGVAWSWHGRDLLEASELLQIPMMIVKKLGFYVRLLRTPQLVWNRTAREIKDQSPVDSE